MIDQVIPFRYLTRAQRDALRDELEERPFEVGDVLVRQGDSDDRSVFLLDEGVVEMVDRSGLVPLRLGLIHRGHYFGERAALFDEPRRADVRGVEAGRVLVIPGQRFLALVGESVQFAQALGKILRDKQGIFEPFDRFRSELLRALGRGSVDLKALIPLYLRVEPALHPLASSSDLDLDALVYAVRRLPANVTRTLAFYLTESLPLLYSNPDRRFQAVPTAARRRSTYEMIPGKNMVLIRDGLSDVVDLISCLCLYTIEARKIRRRIRDRGGLDLLEDEAAVLQRVWPDETKARLEDVALHHEDFRIEIHKELGNYNSAHAESWSDQIAAATHVLLGCDPADLPADFPVHIVSSNTHSVTNCLSPWLVSAAPDIMAWAETTGHALVEERWANEYDLVCALARDYLLARPGERAAKREEDEVSGILSLDWTAFTGIAVQLADCERLAAQPMDPAVTPPSGAPGLIVNIDYAFGEQAGHIIANLIALFGRNLRSVSVLGKAGGLEGSRGDVMVASGFVEQARDLFHPLPREPAVDSDRLRRLLPDRAIRRGHLLTVTGTLLQNRTMLHFNRHVWRCIGLEMEGSYYLRQILESMHRGAVAQDLALRFLYYVSDLPLDHASNLSARLQAIEGVPPLYAVTREVLSGIFGPGGERDRSS